MIERYEHVLTKVEQSDTTHNTLITTALIYLSFYLSSHVLQDIYLAKPSF